MSSLAFLLVSDPSASLHCSFFCLLIMPYRYVPNTTNASLPTKSIRNFTLKLSLIVAFLPRFYITRLGNLIFADVILLACLSRIVQLSVPYIVVSRYNLSKLTWLGSVGAQ